MSLQNEHQSETRNGREASRLGLTTFMAVTAGTAALGGALPASAGQQSDPLQLAAWSQPNTDAKSLEPLHVHTSITLRTDGSATALAWSANGETLASASDFGRNLIVWNAPGQRVSTFRRDISYVGNSLAFLAGSQSLLTPPARDNPQQVTDAMSVIDTQSGRVSLDIAGPAPTQPAQFNRAVAFEMSPDATRIAAITSLLPAQPVTLYGIRPADKSWMRLASLPMPAADSAACLAFSPDGRHLAIGTSMGRILLFDLAEPGRAPATIAAYQAPPTIAVEALAFNHDGTVLASGAGLLIGLRSEDPAATQATAPVKLWHIQDLSLVASHSGSFAPVHALSWGAHDTLAVAAGDRTLRLFQGQTTATPIVFDEPVAAARFAPDGNRLAVASGDTVRIITVSN